MVLFILVPAARFLPYGAIRVFCRGLVVPLFMSPLVVDRLAGISRSHGVGLREAFQILWTVETVKFADLVIAHRWCAGKERIEDWKVTEVNAEGVEALRAAGRPFVVATGHFCREAIAGLFFAPDVLKGDVIAVVASSRPTFDPLIARAQVALGLMLNGLTAARRGGVELFYAGSSFSSMSKLVARLKRPSTSAVIAIDAQWERSHHHVSFAGERDRAVARGAAVLARLSGCPVVPCVPVLVGPRRIVIEWGRVIPASDRYDKNADARVIEEALGFIERAIGHRPEQYVGSLVYEKRWNMSTRCWDEDEAALPHSAGISATVGFHQNRDE
jgi:lauroyl/myristoyl acyltransferase